MANRAYSHVHTIRIFFQMNILIATEPLTTLWEYKQGYVKKIKIDLFTEHDCCYPGEDFKMYLPMELQLRVLYYLLDIYLETRNFDLICELVSTCKLYAKQIYNYIFGKSKQSLNNKISQTIRILNICQKIYDYYLSSNLSYIYAGVKLVGTNCENGNLNIWEYDQGISAVELNGVIYDDGGDVFSIDVGENYGSQVWITGYYSDKDGYYKCTDIQTPVINIILCDEYDVLMASEKRLKNNTSINTFANLLRKAFGTRTSINFMIRQDEDYDNIFITNSNIFYSL